MRRSTRLLGKGTVAPAAGVGVETRASSSHPMDDDDADFRFVFQISTFLSSAIPKRAMQQWIHGSGGARRICLPGGGNAGWGWVCLVRSARQEEGERVGVGVVLVGAAMQEVGERVGVAVVLVGDVTGGSACRRCAFGV